MQKPVTLRALAEVVKKHAALWGLDGL